MGYPNIHIPNYVPYADCLTWTCVINETITDIIQHILVAVPIFVLAWFLVTLMFGILTRLSILPNPVKLMKPTKDVTNTKYRKSSY